MLNINDLYIGLEQKFSQSTVDLSDLYLIKPGVALSVVEDVNVRLGVELPHQFREIVTTFDFSKLSIANLSFEYGKNLQSFLKLNLGLPFGWWGRGPRPSDLLLVGSTDGHSILLSVESGSVLAVEKAAGIEGRTNNIAEDFEQLICIAGSLALENRRDVRAKTALMLSDASFWSELANGTA